MRPPTVISGGQERVCLVTGVLVGMMTDITRTPRYCTNETALLLSIPLGDDHCLFFFFFFFFCTVTTVTATTTTTAIVTATTTTDSRRSRDNSSSRTNPEIRELHLADHRADTASQTKTQRQEILASHDTALGLHRQSRQHRRQWLRQILPHNPALRRPLHPHTRRHHRRRIRLPHHPLRPHLHIPQPAQNQAPNLGHRRPRVLPRHHALLLPRRHRSPTSLRHYAARHIYACPRVARGAAGRGGAEHQHNTRGEQE